MANNINNNEEEFSELESESLSKGDEKQRNKLKKENWFIKWINSMNHSKVSGINRTPFEERFKMFFHINTTSKYSQEPKFFYKLKNWWPLSKISGKIFLIYLITVVLGMVLLAIPGVVIHNDNSIHNFKWDLLTSLFTTSSAFSDTGINIANVSNDYSFWGQLIIVLLIEVGGIGILTFKIVLYLALNKKISINDTTLAQTERGSSTLSSAVVLIRDGFVWLTIVQVTAAGILFFAFYFSNPASNIYLPNNQLGDSLQTVSPYHNFAKSLWYAIFHSTSAINNAGFDIVSGNSLQPYNQQGHMYYLIQIVFMLEWIIGGLGYPTFHDIKRKIKGWRTGRYVQFSLFTKLNFIVYGILLIAGPLAVFGFEYSAKSTSLIFNYYTVNNGQINLQGSKPIGQAVMDIIFNTTSTRNAGFSTVSMNDFDSGSKTVMSILMFIGSAPSSTAGGIRTTTLAILILANWSIIRDRSQVTAFKKTIPDKTVKRAMGVLFLSIIICAVAILISYGDSHSAIEATNSTHDHYTGDSTIVQLLLLITSAFGTVGMNPFSPQQTYALGALTKVVVIIVMFLGQLGISNTLQIFVKSSSQRQWTYLQEDVTIG